MLTTSTGEATGVLHSFGLCNSPCHKLYVMWIVSLRLPVSALTSFQRGLSETDVSVECIPQFKSGSQTFFSLALLSILLVSVSFSLSQFSLMVRLLWTLLSSLTDMVMCVRRGCTSTMQECVDVVSTMCSWRKSCGF